jgi:hypothetical protein
MSRRSAGCAAGLSLFALAVSLDARYQACDPQLRPQPGQWGYQKRGDRCEGLYEELVSEGALRPVSLVSGEAPLPVTDVALSWPRPSSTAEVALTATSLKPTMFYRMDALVRGTTYRWATDVVRALKVGEKELGIMAMTQEVVGKAPRRVYLPVTLGSRTDAAPAQYILRVASPEDLNDVVFGVWHVDQAGNRAAVAVAERSLKRPYYASSSPVSFAFNLPPARPGLYEVAVSGIRAAPGGGGTSTTFLMRHER